MLRETTEIPTDPKCNTPHKPGNMQMQCVVVKMLSGSGSSSPMIQHQKKTYLSQPSNVKLTVRTIGLALNGWTNTCLF